MSMNIIEKSVQEGYTFNTTKGLITTQDLYGLPLTSTRANIITLNSVAISLNREIKEATEESFVDDVSPANKLLESKLEVVKHVIKFKKDKTKAAQDASQKKAALQELLELKDRKLQEQKSEMSMEDIDKQIAALAS